RSLRSPPVVIIDAPRDPVQGGRRMAKVGLYLDLRNPPASRQHWHRLYDFTLELCEEAERLGADSVWLSEHHLFEDGYLTQPLTYAAAIAARTSRVRIGTAVVIAPSVSRPSSRRTPPSSTSCRTAGWTSVSVPATGCRSSSSSGRRCRAGTPRRTRSSPRCGR